LRSLHFLINRRSGGGRGAALAAVLRARVGDQQVHELDRLGSGELPTLARRIGAGSALVACGGDGTASAVADALWRCGSAAPALGIIPLGTGNDLARSLGWSGREPAADGLEGVLAALAGAHEQRLDRWRLDGPDGPRAWFNYLSLGVDARVAQRFHHLRLAHPRLARGPSANRAIYAVLGLQQRAIDLAGALRLDGGPRLPRWASALVLASIPSYAGGVQLASGMRSDDGRLELVALGHGLALGLVTGHLRRPRLLQRAAGVGFLLGRPLAMQLDGEAFTAPSGHYRVAREGQVRALRAGGPL
jgi:diacylglycerol kinase (ATP)